MKQVAVYCSERRSNASRKEDLIYDSIDLALDLIPEVISHRPLMPDAESHVSRPGLRELRPHETIIALGRAAHTVLADYRKRTLVAGVEDEDGLSEDLERLVWSCVNTSKVVALGRSAWRSVQMLPIRERCFFETPPLRLASTCDGKPADEIRVLVINHEGDDHRAQQVGDALFREGYLVQRTGRGEENEGCLSHGGWSTSAAIHVHVGLHDIRADEVRLVDSWHSRRLVILLAPRRHLKDAPEGTLVVDPDIDGILCNAPEKVVSACADIRSDALLRKKMLHAGAIRAAPLAREWMNIAKELLL